MDVGSYMHATVTGQLADAGTEWINTWTFYCSAATDFNALQNIGSYIVPSLLETFYGPLEGTLSQYCAATSVALREYGNAASGYDWAGLAILGTYAGQPYPAFVTANIELVRDNYAFKNGRKGIAGLAAIHTGNNGKMLPASQAAISDLVEGWADEWHVEAGEAEYTFVARIVHNPSDTDTVPTAFSDVRQAVCRGLGSQNTRK